MMKSVLLLGIDKFGYNIAEKLASLNHEVMAIDIVEKRVSDVAPLVTNALIGDCTDEVFMQTIGIDNFDVCIVALGENFQSSLETVALLKELGAKFVVAQVASDVQAKFLLRNGADEIIYPEKQLATWTAVRFTMDNVFDYIELDREHAIFEVAVPEAWAGKTVGAIDIRKKHSINLLATRKAKKLNLSITTDTVLEKGDTLLVLGDVKTLHKLFKI